MPVTKTAKRALRSSKRKEAINTKVLTNLEAAIRIATKTKTLIAVKKAISLTDRAVKKNVIHRNKGNRIKSSLSELLLKQTPKTKEHKKTTSE